MAKVKKPKKVKQPKKRMNPMAVFNQLTGEIKELIASKPELEGLEGRIAELFVSHGLKPDSKNINRIVEDYRSKKEAAEAPEEA